jgi:hypothetical protein
MKKIIGILILSSALLLPLNTFLAFASSKKLPKVGFIKKQLSGEATGSHCTFTNGSASARKNMIFIDAFDGSYMNLDNQDIKLKYTGSKHIGGIYKRSYKTNSIEIQLSNKEHSNRSTFIISNGNSSKVIKALCWSNEG